MGWFDFELPGAISVYSLLFLGPALVALLVRDSLVKTEKRSAKDAWLPALGFAVPIYGALLLLSLVERFGLTPTFPDGKFNLVTVFAAALIAVSAGFIVGVLESRGTIQRVLFKRGLTRKCKVNAWVGAFEDARGKWAVVVMQDGTEFYGWPMYYSKSGKEPTIYLARGPHDGEDVTVQHLGEAEKLLPGAGVLLGPDAGISHVIFVG